MTIKKGSLIRRLAQERRDGPESASGENNGGMALSLDGLLNKETPAPKVPAEPVAVVPEPPLKVDGAPTVPAVLETPVAPVPQATPEGKGATGALPAPAHAESLMEKHTAFPRLGRAPGRQRKRHGAICVRHPGEEKRVAGARAWLTPEESEKLELLATAYQVSTSTLTRDIILEGLAAHSDLIEKTRRFLDSLGKGRASA